MPELEPSPRALKRRKINTYGSSRSTLSEKSTAAKTSIWDNVSSSVTGLSRRLFSGSRPSKSAQVDDSAYASQDEIVNDVEAGKSVIVGVEDVVPADEPDLSIAEGIPTTSASRTRFFGRSGNPKTGEQDTYQSENERPLPNSAVEADEISTPSKEARKLRKGRVPRKESAKNTTGETTAAQVSVDEAECPPPREDTSDVFMEDVEEDSITVQTRTSGRERIRNRKYSVEPAEIQQKSETTKAASAKKMSERRDDGKKITKQLEPKGILTPSKRNENRSRKSVVFDDREKQIQKDLEFKDISKSIKKSQKPRWELQAKSTPSKLPNESKKGPLEEESNQQVEHEINADPDDPFSLERLPFVVPDDSVEDEVQEQNENEPIELQRIKATVLARLTNRATEAERPPLPSHLLSAYNTLHTLLQTTISSGESNSLLLLGSRGAGKSLLVNTALADLQRSSSTDFHTVRLNGFIQTDDRLALREIWRQLGREMEVDEEETNQVVGSYADTMISLLGLLSQPEEVPDIGAVQYDTEKVVTKSVVFVLDEFDLFTTHPRQTLLYNLFDIAQSRKAPIAVIGCSARTDCVECLEKRVKSRFSHRWMHVGPPKTLAAFEDVVRENLLVQEKKVGGKKQEQEWAVKWNDYIKSTFLPSPSIQSIIRRTFYTTKSLHDLFAALYIPIATASLSSAPGTTVSSSLPPTFLSLLPDLPQVHLALLICATRLETIHSLTHFNFNIVYAHYTDLLTKSKLAASASGAAASGMRLWSRDVCLKTWEELLRWDVLIKVGGGKEEGVGEDARMCRVDVSIEEVRWAVEKLGVGIGEGLARWCKEI